MTSAAPVSLLAVGAGRSKIVGLSAEAAIVPAGRGCGVATGSACRSAPAESGVGNLATGTSVLEAAVEAVLSGEFGNLLPKCGVVRWLNNASERRLEFDLGNAVRTQGCGLQVALVLAGQEALYVAGLSAGPDASYDVIRHLWCETLEVSQELGLLTVANFLERYELPDALFCQFGLPPHKLGPQ